MTFIFNWTSYSAVYRKILVSTFKALHQGFYSRAQHQVVLTTCIIRCSNKNQNSVRKYDKNRPTVSTQTKYRHLNRTHNIIEISQIAQRTTKIIISLAISLYIFHHAGLKKNGDNHFLRTFLFLADRYFLSRPPFYIFLRGKKIEGRQGRKPSSLWIMSCSIF